jgi:hypothetical protein
MVCSCVGHIWSMRHGFLVSCAVAVSANIAVLHSISSAWLHYKLVKSIRDKCITLSIIMHAVQLMTTRCCRMSWLGLVSSYQSD